MEILKVKGAKPKPTALKIVQGNPGKRALNKREPKPARKKPTCPQWLSKEAKKAFRELARYLDNAGIITIVDGKALELLTEAYSEWKAARQVVQEKGATYSTITLQGAEMIRPRPEVGIAQDAWKRIKSILPEFGLTPSARVRLTVDQIEDVDPIEDYLGASKQICK